MIRDIYYNFRNSWVIAYNLLWCESIQIRKCVISWERGYVRSVSESRPIRLYWEKSKINRGEEKWGT